MLVGAFPLSALNKRDHVEGDSLQIRTNKYAHQGKADDRTKSVVPLLAQNPLWKSTSQFSVPICTPATDYTYYSTIFKFRTSTCSNSELNFKNRFTPLG